MNTTDGGSTPFQRRAHGALRAVQVLVLMLSLVAPAFPAAAAPAAIPAVQTEAPVVEAAPPAQPVLAPEAPQSPFEATLALARDANAVGVVVPESSSPTNATIASEQPDYRPGATVTLTGAGWTAGEVVHIFVNDNIAESWSLDSGQGDAAPDPVAGEDGSFTYQFVLPNWFVAIYNVIATGPTSGVATTTFTDAGLTLTKVATPRTFAAVGDVITYQFTVKNDTNGALNGIFTVTDNKTTGCSFTANLAKGATGSCTATYAVTAGDITAGYVQNTASASGPGGRHLFPTRT